MQKGIYDDLIKEAADLTVELEGEDRIVELANLLNAHHGLRLASRFSVKISVELHTALSHDAERSIEYGRRYFALCPEQFIVKVPLTAAGLIATRQLRSEGIPVNFTLGFSARQNYLATRLSRPSWVNVFIGRLAAYVGDNGIGDPEGVGEKAVLASQRVVRELSVGAKEPTLQIAASMRTGQQVVDLAGLDTYTMPTGVADQALELGVTTLGDQSDNDPTIQVDAAARPEVISEIDPKLVAFCDSCDDDFPKTAEDLTQRAHDHGCGDLLPTFSAEDLQYIDQDGKIPLHERWAKRIADGELAIDSLLNLAGLASFVQDQAKMDAVIEKGLS